MFKTAMRHSKANPRARRAPLVALLVTAALSATAATLLGAGASAAPTPVPVKITGVLPEDLPGYKPVTADVAVGGSVRWTYVSNDGLEHNVKANDGSFDSGTLDEPSDPPFQHSFTSKGRVRYFCTFHDNMKGVVRVGGTRVADARLVGAHGKVRKSGKRFRRFKPGKLVGFSGEVAELAHSGATPTGKATLEVFRGKGKRKLRFAKQPKATLEVPLDSAGAFSGSLDQALSKGYYRARLAYGGDPVHLDSSSSYLYLAVR